MKHLATLLLIVCTCTAYGQTTETEFNYIKKGLQTSFEQGLDIKKGYYLVDAAKSNFVNATLEAKQLMRLADSSIAGTWVKITVTGTFGGNGAFIFCIPQPDFENQKSFGWEQLWSDLDKPSMETAKRAMLQWLAYQFSYTSNRANELRKKVKTK